MPRQMKMIETQIGEQAASQLWHIGAIMDKSKSPGGKGFRLKLHQARPEAPLSPVYVNLRLLQSHPWAMKSAVRVYQHMLNRSNLRPDLLAGIPHAGTPITACLMQATGIPMITPRPAPKEHGTGGSVDGHFSEEQVVLMIDDLITESESKVEAAQTLEHAGLVVCGACVLVDREQGGAAAMAESGYELISAFTFSDLLDFYRAQGSMDDSMYDEIKAYFANN